MIVSRDQQGKRESIVQLRPDAVLRLETTIGEHEMRAGRSALAQIFVETLNDTIMIVTTPGEGIRVHLPDTQPHVVPTHRHLVIFSEAIHQDQAPTPCPATIRLHLCTIKMNQTVLARQALIALFSEARSTMVGAITGRLPELPALLTLAGSGAAAKAP